jgi:hypothetical protein
MLQSFDSDSSIPFLSLALKSQPPREFLLAPPRKNFSKNRSRRSEESAALQGVKKRQIPPRRPWLLGVKSERLIQRLSGPAPVPNNSSLEPSNFCDKWNDFIIYMSIAHSATQT